MIKMTKRIVSCLLAVLLCAMSTAVFAAPDAGSVSQFKMSDAPRAYCARSGGSKLHQEGAHSVWAVGSWVEFDVNISSVGRYNLGLICGANGSDILMHRVTIDGNVVIEQETKDDGVVATGTFNAQKETVIGQVSFEEAGSHTVRLDFLGVSAIYADYMALTYLGEPIELVSIAAGAADVMAGDAVSAGCDAIVAEFSKNVSEELEESLDGCVSLEDASGNAVTAYASVNNNILTIMLADSLKAGKEYVLKLKDVKDFLGASSVFGKEFRFVTEEGEGAATISDVVASVDGEKITIEAVMLSSQGIGISQRSYEIYMSYGDAEAGDAPICTGQTEADGVIFAEYTMPQGSLDGTYKVHVDGEYVTERETAALIFVSAATKSSIKDALAACQTADDVEALLTDATNAEYIGINPQTEIGSLQKAAVYEHFLGKEIDFDNIAGEFKKYVSVESFRQATTAAKVRQAAMKESNWINMGLEKGKLDLIPTAKQVSIFNAIKNNSSITDADEYIAGVDLILNNELMTMYSKTGLTPVMEDVSVYVNQGTYIPIVFAEDFSEVIQIDFKLTVSDASMMSVSELTLDVPGALTYGISGNVLEGTIVFDTLLSAKNLGKLSVTIPNVAGTYTAELEGKVHYAPADCEFILYSDIARASMTITASEKPAQTPSAGSQRPASGRGSGSSGSSGSGNIFIPPVLGENGSETQKEEAYSFSDVSKEHWAYESVDYLLKKEIIEKTADNKYNPDQKANREDIVKMMVTVLGLTDENAESKLSDIDKSNPYYKYIASAEKYGIIYGNDLGQFMIGQPITREDICVILHRAVKKIYGFSQSSDLFADDSSISDYAKEAVYCMRGAKMIEGVGDNSFMPKGDVTNAQAAKMIYEIVKAVGR